MACTLPSLASDALKRFTVHEMCGGICTVVKNSKTAAAACCIESPSGISFPLNQEYTIVDGSGVPGLGLKQRISASRIGELIGSLTVGPRTETWLCPSSFRSILRAIIRATRRSCSVPRNCFCMVAIANILSQTIYKGIHLW